MKWLNLDGQKVSQIGMGTWGLGESPEKRPQELEALRYGLKHGCNVIDTAEMYGEGQSESLVGDAIKDFPRRKLFLISKFYPWHATPDQERKSLKASLSRLGTDYLDLYLLHWRSTTPLKQTLSGLEKLRQEGLIRHWGVSNFDVSDLEEAEAYAPVQANEVLYNLRQRGIEYDLIPHQQQKEEWLFAYSPFNSGQGDSIPVTANLKQIADAHQVTVHQVMLSWTLRQKTVISLPKASTTAHMKENLSAADLILSPEELQLLDQDFQPPKHKQPLAVI